MLSLERCGTAFYTVKRLFMTNDNKKIIQLITNHLFMRTRLFLLLTLMMGAFALSAQNAGITGVVVDA